MMKKNEKHDYTYRSPLYLPEATLLFIIFLVFSGIAWAVLSFQLAWLVGKRSIVKTTEDKNRVAKEYNKIIHSLTLYKVK